MLDLANLFGRFNPVRTVNPYLFAGVGVSGAFDNDEANAICDKGYAMENVWSGGKVFVAGRLVCGIEFPAFGLRAAGRGGECRHALR